MTWASSFGNSRITSCCLAPLVACLLASLPLVGCNTKDDDGQQDATDTVDAQQDTLDDTSVDPVEDTDDALDVPVELPEDPVTDPVEDEPELECAVDDDCNDSNPCTDDSCDEHGACVNESLGCWYDGTTGYLWEDPPSEDGWPQVTWEEAAAYCEALSLAGRGAGEWQLPSIDMLRTLVRGCAACETGGVCGVADDCLTDTCWSDPCAGCERYTGPGEAGCFRDPEMQGDYGFYWSSSESPDDTTHAWEIDFTTAYIAHCAKTDEDAVRCVSTGS